MHWLDLKTPVVRDLAWAGFSAPLLPAENLPNQDATITSPVLAWDGFWQQTLAQLDHDPAPLLLHLEQRRGNRLGLYFESLWHFLLREDPGTVLLATNLPVHDNGRTVGEFDCLYYCAQRKRSIHLELAVKYYLGNPADGVWIGPGCKDRLDYKLNHLLQHQIRLSRHPAAQEVLMELDAVEPALEIGLKGHLFTPPDGMPLPDGVTPHSGTGTWHTLKGLEDFAASQAACVRWYWLPRERWLAPCLLDDGQGGTLDDLFALLHKHFSTSRQPQLVVGCDEDGIEQCRCFVTDVNWPWLQPGVD